MLLMYQYYHYNKISYEIKFNYLEYHINPTQFYKKLNTKGDTLKDGGKKKFKKNKNSGGGKIFLF